MSPGLRQAALVLLFVGAIGLIGSTRPTPMPASPPAVTETRTTVPHAAATPRSAPALAPTSTTTTAPPAARPLSVVTHPSGTEVEITLTDASGTTTASGGFAGEAVGEVALEVSAPGFEAESHVIPAGWSGSYEVFLDAPGQLVDRTMVTATGAAPKQVAFSPDGSELWVTLLAGTGLEIYDPHTGRRLGEVDLPEAGSVEVIFDSEGETAWVSQMETARVYEIEVETRRVVRDLDTEGSWTKVMALSPDETRLWASNWVSDDVSELDLETGRLLRRLPTVATPRGLVTDEDGSKLYVAGYGQGEIQVIDLETGEGEVIHHTGGAMRHVVREPGGTIFASDMARDMVYSVDPRTDTVEELVATDRLPNTIDVSPDGRVLAVSNRGSNNPETYQLPGPEWGSVLLYDISSGEMLDAVVAGNQPTGLDVSPDGAWLAYSDFLDNRVTVLALPSTDELRAGAGGRSATYSSELPK